MRRNVYFYTQLDVGFEEGAALLADDPARWLPAPAEPAGKEWRVTLDATGAVPPALAHRLALVHLDPLARLPDRAWRRLRWRDAAAGRRFPVLEADLELEALIGGTSRLCLVGSYEPPGAFVGGLADAAVGHRVAETGVRRFVLDVAASLEQRRHQDRRVGSVPSRSA